MNNIKASSTSHQVLAWGNVLFKLHRALLTSAQGEGVTWPLRDPLGTPLSPPELLQIQEMKEAFKSQDRALLESTLEYVARVLAFEALDAQLIARSWINQSNRESEFNAFKWPSHLADFESAWQTLISNSGSVWEPSAGSPNLGLYAVLPNSQWVERMAQAGVPTVQLRFKSNDTKAIEREIHDSVRAVQGTATRLFINDHWLLAIEAGAHGVHLGQEDLEALEIQGMEHIKRSGLLLGLSTHGYSEMMNAHRFRPSYMALGAVFPTTLKQMKTLPQGLGRLHQYANLMQSYSLVGIGGIDEHTIPMALASGVGSVAVVRAITGAPEPEKEAKRLMKLF